MKTHKVHMLVLKNRGAGNTTWILRAAIWNPKCVIVGRDLKSVDKFEIMYDMLLDKLKWYHKLLRRFMGINKIRPLFKSVDSNLDSIELPMIFDNSALL